MKIIDVLNLAAEAGTRLREWLLSVGVAAPDFKADADGFVAILDAAVSPANILALASAVLAEVKDIVAGKLNPRRHVGDAS